MSISGISGQNYYNNAIYNQQSNSQQMQTDFAQLGQDLQSGNLTQAQSDFTALQSLFSNGTQSGTTDTTTSASSSQPQNLFQQMQTDFAQLGQDLQSSNLTQAQSDYSNLQSLQQSIHASHHHGGHGGGMGDLAQLLNTDSTQNNTTTTTAAQNTSDSQNNNSQQSTSLSSIENLIAQYMQNMLSGMGTQASQEGTLNPSSILNISI